MIPLYQFETLIGSVYRKGNIKFVPTGDDILLSPVGNRITAFDLKNNSASTISVESSHNYVAIDVSPNGFILAAGNEIGEVHIISLVSQKLLHLLKVGECPLGIRFSPNGRYFSVLKHKSVIVYEAPSAVKSVNPYYQKLVIRDFQDSPKSVDWSYDSKLIGIGGKDNCIRISSLEKYANFRQATLIGHGASIVNIFFQTENYNLISVSSNGVLCIWKCSEQELISLQDKENKLEAELSDDDFGVDENLDAETHRVIKTTAKTKSAPVENRTPRMVYKKEFKHYLKTSSKHKRPDVTCADFNKSSLLLVVGYTDGTFAVHKILRSISCVEISTLQTLSLGEQEIPTVSLNTSGEWIAFGCPNLGQLLVWEWLSETYILKQQSHFDTMNACAYSPNASHIATGGEDGKVKVWEAGSSFCFITFSDHTGPVTGLAFTQNGKAVLSSSADGTVRAFDLVRYRNFRTFTPHTPAQFSCVSVDTSGELVAAGSFNLFDIFVWSMKTGRLIQVLSKHTGPVAELRFNPTLGSSQLASVSWDKSLRLWDILRDATPIITLEFPTEVTCLAFRPDGAEVAIATLDCHITFCSTENPTEFGSIEGRNHMGSGRMEHDKITAAKSLQGKAFSCLAYSPDGSHILAGGQSRTICLYNASRHILLRKFQITQNKSLDGINEFFHHRKLTEFGNLNLVEDRDDGDKQTLPGVKRGDLSSRSTMPEVRVSSIQFSPSGESWITTTTEGLLVYTQHSKKVFLPLDVDESITPANIRLALKQAKYDTALIQSVLLNIPDLCQEVIENIPLSHVEAICKSVPQNLHVQFLNLLSRGLGTSKHTEFFLIWCEKFLELNLMEWKRNKNPALLAPFSSLQRNILRVLDTTNATYNNYSIQYIRHVGRIDEAEDKTE